MNAWKTADAVVRRLEAAIPVYDAPLEGDVRQATCRRTLAAELRVRDDVGGWDR